MSGFAEKVRRKIADGGLSWKWAKPGVSIRLSVNGLMSWKIYACHHERDWSKKGPVKAWDGNLEKPTLSPSIALTIGEEEVWHGFLKSGKLVT